MKLDEAINQGYFGNIHLQEAEDAQQLETAANHFILASDTGKAQVMEINGFLIENDNKPLLAPGNILEIGEEEDGKALAQSMIQRGTKMLAEGKRVLVACMVFVKDAVSDDGVKYLDPWEGGRIELEEAPSLMSAVNCCFFNYVTAFMEGYHLDIEELDPRPLAFAYHWDCKDTKGATEFAHVHLMFAVSGIPTE